MVILEDIKGNFVIGKKNRIFKGYTFLKIDDIHPGHGASIREILKFENREDAEKVLRRTGSLRGTIINWKEITDCHYTYSYDYKPTIKES